MPFSSAQLGVKAGLGCGEAAQFAHQPGGNGFGGHLDEDRVGTPSPVSASRARDDVPASPPITDTDVTVRP